MLEIDCCLFLSHDDVPETTKSCGFLHLQMGYFSIHDVIQYTSQCVMRSYPEGRHFQYIYRYGSADWALTAASRALSTAWAQTFACQLRWQATRELERRLISLGRWPGLVRWLRR